MDKFEYYTPQVVLAVGAHPDDIDFSASGSIARWIDEGATVHYLVLTDGGSGTTDPTVSADHLKEVRRTEQQNAVATLGAAGVHFLDYCDGSLENSLELRKDIIRQIRTLKPDTVVVFDPTFVYSSRLGFINHPDHRAAGQATLDAVFPLARDHLSFPELFTEENLSPHKVQHVLLVNLDTSNYHIDIADYFDAKLSGLFEHKSQIKDKHAVRKQVNDQALYSGKKAGLELAEGFIRIDIPD
jgi:LmbE family N-acetylglucosaminyl deacetylase